MEGPTKSLVFLGLQIDSVAQTVTIPLEKLMEIRGKNQNSHADEKSVPKTIAVPNWFTQLCL